MVVGESWGARLRLGEPPDLSLIRAALRRAVEHGAELRGLDFTCAEAVADLEARNNADYPYTPATAQPSADGD